MIHLGSDSAEFFESLTKFKPIFVSPEGGTVFQLSNNSDSVVS
ncbi:uncharacterized protein METZ01_LOCUS476314 [marine metagenome]|uniref:Uncharacterized protein n=1 Tax=marine metagenome TaxID=408172 RepID=A0A383BUI2_9ZZZZ